MNTTYSLLQPSVDSINSLPEPRIIGKSDGNSVMTPQASINPMTQTQSKMISVSKSKEYSKLANQIPGIYNIDRGQKVLNTNGASKEKQFSSSRYSTTTQSRLGQQQPRPLPTATRASVNVTTNAAEKSQHLPSLAFDVTRSL